MTHVLSVISFKTNWWYWWDWSAMILKSYLSIYLFPCLQHWTQALDLGIWVVRSLREFFILGTWLLEQALSSLALWVLPDPPCLLFLITKIQNSAGGYVNNRLKEKWSSLYSRDHLLAKLSPFPCAGSEFRAARPAVLDSVARSPHSWRWAQVCFLKASRVLCPLPACEAPPLEQSVWLAILPGRCVPRPGLVFHLSTPGAAGVSGTATHVGWDPHQLWAIFPTFGCERHFRPAGTEGEMRGQA